MAAIEAPFTPEQVENLNGYQRCGAFHPFTCSGGGGPHSDLPGRPAVLVAREDGWHCPVPDCTHHQTWAHTAMADGSWQEWGYRGDQSTCDREITGPYCP